MSFWHGRCHLPFPSQPIMPAEPQWWPAKHGQPCTAFWNPNLALLWWPVNGDRESLQSMAGSGEFPAAAQLPADQAEEQQCRSLYQTACADWGRKGLRSHFRLLSLPFLKPFPSSLEHVLCPQTWSAVGMSAASREHECPGAGSEHQPCSAAFARSALPVHASSMMCSCPQSLGMQHFLVYSQAAGNTEM